jgi:hypothetical protein
MKKSELINVLAKRMNTPRREAGFIANTLLAALTIVFLVSCAHTHDIAGTWQEPGTTSSIEFRQNGTFTVVDNMGMAVSGNYTLQAKGKIQFEIKSPDTFVEIITGILTVQGDELILTFDEGKEVLTYKKVQ